MNRIQRIFTVPGDFFTWTDERKYEWLWGCRSRILRFYLHDVFMFKMRIWSWKFEISPYLLFFGCLLGFAEFATELWLDSIFGLFLFSIGMLSRDFIEGFRND